MHCASLDVFITRWAVWAGMKGDEDRITGVERIKRLDAIIACPKETTNLAENHGQNHCRCRLVRARGQKLG